MDRRSESGERAWWWRRGPCVGFRHRFVSARLRLGIGHTLSRSGVLTPIVHIRAIDTDVRVCPPSLCFVVAVFSSYGSVYKALDKRDGKLVAIKVLEVENEDTVELQKEINILKECDCEWIVRYKGSYRKDGNIWIVRIFCKRPSRAALRWAWIRFFGVQCDVCLSPVPTC